MNIPKMTDDKILELSGRSGGLAITLGRLVEAHVHAQCQAALAEQEPVGKLIRGEGGAFRFQSADSLLPLYAMPPGEHDLYALPPMQQEAPGQRRARLEAACSEVFTKPQPEPTNPAAQERAEPVAPAVQPFIHKKSGGKYQFVGLAQIQTDTPLNDMAPVTVYRGEDGRLWVRTSSEFVDRFHQEGRPRMLCDDFIAAEDAAGGVLAINPEIYAALFATPPVPAQPVPQSLLDAVLHWYRPEGDSMGACKNLLNEIQSWLAAPAQPSPEPSKAEQAEAPSVREGLPLNEVHPEWRDMQADHEEQLRKKNQQFVDVSIALMKYVPASEAAAKSVLQKLGDAHGYGWCQTALGQMWDEKHGCAPRGSMGLTVKDAAKQAVPDGYQLVMVPKIAPGDEPDWDECIRQSEEATGIKVERSALSIVIREVRRWLAHRATLPPASAAGEREITDAMVDAYLQANDAYWHETDVLPLRPDKWRNGTPREATRVSLRAALATKPQAEQEWREHMAAKRAATDAHDAATPPAQTVQDKKGGV